MAFVSLKEFVGRMGFATPAKFEEWCKAWRVAVESGSQETLLAFVCRERGVAEDAFLEELAKALNWPYLDLPRLKVPAEARTRISTKVAFQYSVIPTQITDGALQVAVSNPFDTAMLNAVRFDARGLVRFALAPKTEIEKALKNFYGVGADTLGQMDEKEDLLVDLELPADKEITESDQKPASSSLSTRLSGRPSRTAPRTFISSRPKTSCASATALTASCTRPRCPRSSSVFRRPSSRASRSCPA